MNSYGSLLRDDAFAIFLLHGVIPQQKHKIRNYTRKHLPLDDFISFLKDIKSIGVPVSMDAILSAHRSGESLPKRAFAITFDDGFENNASVAAPVLDEFGIPATFYVTTGFVGSDARSWTDRIEAALEQSGNFRLKGMVKEIDGDYAAVQNKISLMDNIRAYVKGNSQIDQDAFAGRIIEQIGSPENAFDHDLDAKLGWNQLQQLTNHSLFTVGGHGHTHRILSFLTDEELDREVSTSVNLLTQALSKEITHYSYPEGLEHCYSKKVIDCLKQRGVACSPTAVSGLNNTQDSMFHLKRIFVI